MKNMCKMYFWCQIFSKNSKILQSLYFWKNLPKCLQCLHFYQKFFLFSLKHPYKMSSLFQWNKSANVLHILSVTIFIHFIASYLLSKSMHSLFCFYNMLLFSHVYIYLFLLLVTAQLSQFIQTEILNTKYLISSC